jgi:hypothetical protein
MEGCQQKLSLFFILLTSFCLQYHNMSLMDFVVSAKICGWSVTDFWGWETQEARLRYPDEVDGVTKYHEGPQPLPYRIKSRHTAAIQQRATAILLSIPKHVLAYSFQKLYERCQQCVVKDGDYFEGQ